MNDDIVKLKYIIPNCVGVQNFMCTIRKQSNSKSYNQCVRGFSQGYSWCNEFWAIIWRYQPAEWFG
jgi:hypothetical protein